VSYEVRESFNLPGYDTTPFQTRSKLDFIHLRGR
jgi:hypothetical protein